MAKKAIHVVPHNDGWATRKPNTERVGRTFPTQKDAIDHGRDQAQRERAEVVIHRPNGQIRDSDSFGNDPVPPVDKKH
jgi:hypothetical protein